MRAIRRWCALVPGAVLPIVLMTGCSGDGDRDGGTPDTGSSPPSPAVPPSTAGSTTPAPPAGGTPAPPPARDDRAGRVAFAEYVLQAWIHALNNNDAGLLLELSGPRPCAGCADLAGELESRAAEGWYVSLEGVRVGRRQVATDGPVRRVLLSVSVPESASYYTDGRFRSANPGHPNRTFEVEMRPVGDAFRLVSFSLY